MDCFTGTRRDGEAEFTLPVCRQSTREFDLHLGWMSALAYYRHLTPSFGGLAILSNSAEVSLILKVPC
jgi:hypothetical protein